MPTRKPTLENFLRMSGVSYQIERESEIRLEAIGLPNHDKAAGKPFVGFLPETDVQVGDWLVNEAVERFYVQDVITQFVQKTPYQKKAYYLTSAEYKASDNARHPAVFNIASVHGSIIGTQANATLNYGGCITDMRTKIAEIDTSDSDELSQIVDLLEMILSNQTPLQKGMFSKFSDVMQRNSWITSAMMSGLLGWLLSRM